MTEGKRIVRGFLDLEVYQESYAAMLIVFRKLIPFLPPEERFDLKDQLRRSVKAIPRLIAEGHSKRHQKKGFQKYLDDALSESNETMVSIYQARDLYPELVDKGLCGQLLGEYDKICRKIYNLAAAWEKFHTRKQNTSDVSVDTSYRRIMKTSQ